MSLWLNSDEAQAGRQQSIWFLRKMAVWRIGGSSFRYVECVWALRAGGDSIFPAVGATVKSLSFSCGHSPRSCSGYPAPSWAPGRLHVEWG